MIKDIYKGKMLKVWGNEKGIVSLTLYDNAITISFYKEEWKKVLKELKEIKENQNEKIT